MCTAGIHRCRNCARLKKAGTILKVCLKFHRSVSKFRLKSRQKILVLGKVQLVCIVRAASQTLSRNYSRPYTNRYGCRRWVAVCSSSMIARSDSRPRSPPCWLRVQLFRVLFCSIPTAGQAQTISICWILYRTMPFHASRSHPTESTTREV